ncbi:MAG: PaeR7I family type II restriction endonuclease [Elusimicrobiota bacterium]|nr:PaeR7I family type II restriction endonuclease [Elusimicrobiota bacterium]
MPIILNNIKKRTEAAVSYYWKTLAAQSKKQSAGDVDRGRRAFVTGGKQMDGFCHLIEQVLVDNGMPKESIYFDKQLELPGFFRPTKKWDILVVHKNTLVAALEFKSQKGPSFGNNLNNRSEEAIGTAQDLWTAYREGAFNSSPRPWLGYLMLIEDCEASQAPVSVSEPHFPVFGEFKDTSYLVRYELLLRKLVRERLYDAAVLLTSTVTQGNPGKYAEPAKDLQIKQLCACLAGHIATVLVDQR